MHRQTKWMSVCISRCPEFLRTDIWTVGYKDNQLDSLKNYFPTFFLIILDIRMNRHHFWTVFCCFWSSAHFIDDFRHFYRVSGSGTPSPRHSCVLLTRLFLKFGFLINVFILRILGHLRRVQIRKLNIWGAIDASPCLRLFFFWKSGVCSVKQVNPFWKLRDTIKIWSQTRQRSPDTFFFYQKHI